MIKPLIFARFTYRYNQNPTLEQLRGVVFELFNELRANDEMIKKVTRSVYTRMAEVIEQEGRHLLHKRGRNDEIPTEENEDQLIE